MTRARTDTRLKNRCRSGRSPTARRRIVHAIVLAVLAACPSSLPGEQPQAEPPASIAGHPALTRAPRHATTGQGNQGDAVNVALIGTEEEL